MTENIFLDRLTKLIAGRSQKEFAEWVGDIPQKVNDYLTGKARPGWDFLEKLARKGVNVNWLLTGEGAMFVDAPDKARELPPETQELLYELGEDPDLTKAVKLIVKGVAEAKSVYVRKQKPHKKGGKP